MPPVPVCPSSRRQDSIATAQEQTANTIPAAEEAIAGPGAGSAVAVDMDPCPRRSRAWLRQGGAAQQE